MSLNLRGVHVFEKIPGKGEFRLKETHPVMRLSKDEEILFLQDGQVYDASGKVMEKDKLPAWFKDELIKANPVALRESGFKVEVKEKKDS